MTGQIFSPTPHTCNNNNKKATTMIRDTTMVTCIAYGNSTFLANKYRVHKPHIRYILYVPCIAGRLWVIQVSVAVSLSAECYPLPSFLAFVKYWGRYNACVGTPTPKWLLHWFFFRDESKARFFKLCKTVCIELLNCSMKFYMHCAQYRGPLWITFCSGSCTSLQSLQGTDHLS